MSGKLDNYVVTKMNPLIHSTYTMTVGEQRLLLACISQINSKEHMVDGDTYTLTVEQAKSLYYENTNEQNVYRDLSDAVKKLYNRDVIIPLSNGNVLQTRFVQAIEWSPNKHEITITFAKNIRPYLSEIRNNFTGYKLKNIVRLTSSYAIRVYEMIVCWSLQGLSYKEFEINDFKKMLSISDKYKLVGELKVKVIKPIFNQINENTDFNLDVTFKKQGRAFRWIRLEFTKKQEIAVIERQQKAKTLALQHDREARQLIIDKKVKEREEINRKREKKLAQAKALIERKKQFEELKEKYPEFKPGTVFRYRNKEIIVDEYGLLLIGTMVYDYEGIIPLLLNKTLELISLGNGEYQEVSIFDDN